MILNFKSNQKQFIWYFNDVSVSGQTCPKNWSTTLFLPTQKIPVWNKYWSKLSKGNTRRMPANDWHQFTLHVVPAYKILILNMGSNKTKKQR